MTLVFPEMSSLDYNFDIKIEDKYFLKELIINWKACNCKYFSDREHRGLNFK